MAEQSIKLTMTLSGEKIPAKIHKNRRYGHDDDQIKGTQILVPEDVGIGRNVYIHPSAIIYSGVSIGDECVVGAGSHICSDIGSRNTIGEFCFIAKQVRFGSDITLGNHVLVAIGAEIQNCSRIMMLRITASKELPQTNGKFVVIVKKYANDS